MLRRLYERTLELAESPSALWALFAVSFAEASFFPIPPDVMMIPMIIARPRRAFLIAAVALAGSVLGALLGYAIGALFYDQVGEPLLGLLGKADAAAAFSERFNGYGVWAVLVAGLTPFPFKVITIVSGWTGMPLGGFILAAIAARGVRFFLVAALLWRFGAPIRHYIERHLGLALTAFVAILFGGFLLVRYL